MYNKRICILLVTTFIILLAGFTAISAADVNDTSVDTSSLSSTTQVDKSPVLTTVADNDNNIKTDRDDAIKTQLKTTKKVDTESYVTTKESTKTKNTNKTIKTENPTITVTDGNYGKYFDEDGTRNINPNTTVILNGAFYNKTFTIDQEFITLTGNNATLHNGYIYVTDMASNSTISNLVINSTGMENVINNEAWDITIKNNKITLTNSEGITEGITNNGDNVLIVNNTVDVYGPAKDIDWTGGPREGLALTFAIFNDGGNNVIIENNTARSGRSKDGEDNPFGTIDGIELKSGNNVTVSNNYIEVSGARFVYGLNALSEVYNVVLSNNTINVTSERYIAGIQIGNSARNCSILDNKIYGVCYNTTIFTQDNEALAFGIITTSMGGSESRNMTVAGNIMNINATIVYGMEIYTTYDTIIDKNLVNAIGNYSMGMSLAHSPNSIVTNNVFNTTGNSNIPINPIVEEIAPANTGIQIQQNSTNAYIANNIVITTDAGNNAKAVNIETTNNVAIINNTLFANGKTGDDAVNASSNLINITVNDNHGPITKYDAMVILNIPKTISTGSTLNLNFTVKDKETEKLINGKAIVKINGVTLKDDDGEIIKLNVVNGIANLSYILKGYSAKEAKVTIVFANSTYNRAESTGMLNITKTNVKLESKDMTVYTGETITINQTLFDSNNNPIYGNTTVAVKINGVTVKNTKIVNGNLLVNITVPSIKAGKNVLTIILGENNRYNSVSVNSTLTVLKQDPVIKIEKITAKPGEYVTLKATIVSNVTKTPVTSGNYVFKINGMTVNNTDEYTFEQVTVQNITNGIATLSTYMDISANDGVYNVTVVYSGNNHINSGRSTESCLIIKA